MCWSRPETSWNSTEKIEEGRLELTDSFIDMLQNYLGIAIRNNSGDLEAMREGVGASLFHTASSERNLHTLFRDGPDSWCRFKQDTKSFCRATAFIMEFYILGVYGCLKQFPTLT